MILFAALAFACLGCSSSESDLVSPGSVSDSVETSDVALESMSASTGESGSLPIPQAIVYPSTDQWSAASPRQRARAERSFAQMNPRHVPVYEGPLFVDDDQNTKLQPPEEVARRAIILWAVALRAEGTPQSEVMELIDKSSAWQSVSPTERQFLESPQVDSQIASSMVWRLESLWVMLWALGRVEVLDWPADMCNVPQLVEIMRVQESNPVFVNEAKLRNVDEILDAQDLTMRIHWAIRDASLREGATIPGNLDWSSKEPWIPLSQCPGVGVIEERHHALNWLVNFLDPENWDMVDTPT